MNSDKVIPPPQRLSARLVLCLMFLCLVFPGLTVLEVMILGSAPARPAAGSEQDLQPPGQQEMPPDEIWSARASDLEDILKETQRLESRVENQAGPLAAGLQARKTRFARLSGLFQASAGHPTEQVSLMQQMKVLRADLATDCQQLQSIAVLADQRQEEAAMLREALENTNREDWGAAGRAVPNQSGGQGKVKGQDKGQAVGQNEEESHFAGKLEEAEQRLAAAAAKAASVLAPTQAALERIDASIKGFEQSLVSNWENFYLAPSGNDLDALASTPALFTSWVTSLWSHLGFAYPQSRAEWLDSARSFLLCALVFVVLGGLGLRGARRLPQGWCRAVERTLKSSWPAAGLGCSVLVAANNSYGGVYLGFVLLGSLILIAGITAMSWQLRAAAVPRLSGLGSPLKRLYLPSAVGVLMLFSDLPVRVLGIAWALAMLLFLALVLAGDRKRKNKPALPLLERLSYGSALYFGLVSLLMAFAGHARLGILLFMLLFALANIFTMGSALSSLLHTLASKLYNRKASPLFTALFQALSSPAGWLLALFCALPWIWAVPGAHYLLQHLFSTRYTLGAASFDFAKILAIILLFFLFRSLASLGRISLEKLPQKVPHLEKGVIPPLRKVLTYAVWVLFALVVLGILGVNLTSLAVVAGGLSVGVGIGMQSLFNNLVSGLMLLFGRSILVGDFVEVGSVSGTVREITLRTTVLETLERALVYVPNTSLVSGMFTNLTRNGRMVRRSLKVGVEYGSDTELVSRILLDTAATTEHVLKNPPPAVYFSDFGDSALNFTMNVYLDDLDYELVALSQLRYAVEHEFDKNGIDIPYPQMTLHLPQKTDPPAPQAEAAAPAPPPPAPKP